jgi:ubiquinone/menaquinone biosynthesis C-methylase UbiE
VSYSALILPRYQKRREEMKASDQKEAFLSDEGDAWFKRNQEKLLSNSLSPVKDSLDALKIQPKKILEIGCANGYRLEELKQKYNAKCYGVEPSLAAVQDAKKYPGIDVRQGTAEKLPYEDHFFDVVIFGFCLYLCDPKDFFRIAAEADRVLQNNGFLVILDFLPTQPYKNKYTHKEGLYSHKLEWQKMFSWNPAYSLLNRTLVVRDEKSLEEDKRTAVDILCKNTDSGFAERQ